MKNISRHSFDSSLNPGGAAEYQSSSRRGDLERLFAEYGATVNVQRDVVTRRTCPLCKESKNTPLFVKYSVPIAKCTGCGFIYVPIVIDNTLGAPGGKTFLDSLGGSHLAFIQSKTYRHCAALRYQYELGLISRFLPDGKNSFLDVGCSTGQLMEEANAAGWEVYGVEMSSEAAAVAAGLFSNVVNEPYRIGQFGDMRFSAVTALDVLEHIPDPDEFLRALSESVASKGVLFIQVPNAGSLSALLKKKNDNIFNGLIHLNYFTPESLAALGAKAGLTLVHSETVLSEFHLLNEFPVPVVEEVLTKHNLKVPPKITPDYILDSGLGYKILAVFKKNS